MRNSPEEKKLVITRLRRIGGQAEALERAIEAGTDCARCSSRSWQCVTDRAKL